MLGAVDPVETQRHAVGGPGGAGRPHAHEHKGRGLESTFHGGMFLLSEVQETGTGWATFRAATILARQCAPEVVVA